MAIVFGVPVPEPVVPLVFRFLARFFEVIGFIGAVQWMIQNPLISLGAFGALAWVIFSAVTSKTAS